MAEKTTNVGLQKLGPGDSFSTDDYQFTDRDRDVIDRLLARGASTHVHTGANASDNSPDTAPDLSLATTGGTIPAGTTVYYKFTYVDENGSETTASPEASVTTANAISEPGGATLSQSDTGGTLLPGTYTYALSAWVGSNTVETKAPETRFITLPAGSSTYQITLTLPSLPSGADGFNIYRRKPGQSKLFFLAEVDMTVATPPSDYTDDGSVSEDCDRSVPTKNVTNASNKITVTLPGATPTVPDGFTWKLYRTYVQGDYSNSLLHHVVEETSEGSGVITTQFEDTGTGTSVGQPPSQSESLAQPSKINLNNATEVQNKLPLGHVSGFPQAITFTFPGQVETATGTVQWINPFPSATIVNVRLSLGLNKTAGADLTCDVNKHTHGATPTSNTIFTTQANRPKIASGNTTGSSATPDVTSLDEGDTLTVDIDTDGQGATPTAEDLTVQIYLVATFTTSTTGTYTS